MFESIARLVNDRGWIIVAGWLAFSAALYAAAPPWDAVTRDDDPRQFPPDYPSVRGQELLERGFPGDVASSSVVVVAERRDGRLTRQTDAEGALKPGTDFDFVRRVSGRLKQLAADDKGLGIKRVTDYQQAGIGPRLVGAGRDGRGQAVLTLVSLQGTYASKQARLAVDRIGRELEALRAKAPPGLDLQWTGSAAVGHDTNQASARSVDATTWATIVLVVAILLVVYRSPLLALIPLVTIALSAWTALMGIALLAKVPRLNFQVINITKVFVIVVLFGAGTDYCLFLIARYREELSRGRRGRDALAEAIRQVGGALVASAGTVIVGLGMLWFSTFAKIQYTGPAIALSLVIGLVASLTLAPVLLHWLRGTVFWPFRPPHLEKGADPESGSLEETPMAGFWAGVADRVVRRPGAILVASLLALAPLAIVGARTRSNYDLLADLSPDAPSIRGARAVQRYFPPGELGPSYVLVEAPRIDFTKEAGIDAVERVSRRLAELPNVAEVRSISRPLGKTLATVKERLDGPAAAGAKTGKGKASTPDIFGAVFRGMASRSTDWLVLSQSYGVYVGTEADGDRQNHITRIELIFKTSPFAAESLATLDRARQVVEEAQREGGPLAGATAVGLAGTTSLVNDLKRITTKDEQRMYVLVTVGVYLILVALLRRPGICLYLIATVVLGYLASLGLTELVFRALHAGPEPWTGLDWKVGFFLFVILVAIGEDYNIFLMARVIEEERKHGPVEGTRRAVAHTGGIISSCGLIMAGTFGSMLTGSLTTLRELGFALGLGVLLDTFIVRPILVPAFVVLWHRARPSTTLESPVSPHDQAEPAATSAT
jgi:putative drug exporter of the RND superfamily